MNFLVAYDIADPKRLRRVARRLEDRARRVQKSVFMFTGTRHQLDGLLIDVAQVIDVNCDRVQAWPIRTSNHVHRRDLGTAFADQGFAAIVTPASLVVIEALDGPTEDHEPLLLT